MVDSKDSWRAAGPLRGLYQADQRHKRRGVHRRAYESRQLPVCAPYGVYARPVQGQETVVLSAQGGAQLCLGSVTEGWPEGLHPGEILLRSAGGASIKLCSDGKILLNGKEWKEA